MLFIQECHLTSSWTSLATNLSNTLRWTPLLTHYVLINRLNIITMTWLWARWPLKSPASRLFTQPFIYAQIKENIKAPRHWPVWKEFTGEWWIPAQRANNAENVSVWWRHHMLHRSCRSIQHYLESTFWQCKIISVDCTCMPVICMVSFDVSKRPRWQELLRQRLHANLGEHFDFIFSVDCFRHHDANWAHGYLGCGSDYM